MSVCAKLLQSFLTLCISMDCNCQAPLSMEFCRQEYWSGLPCPPLGDLPNPGIKLVSFTSPALAGRFFTPSTTWKAQLVVYFLFKYFTFWVTSVTQKFIFHLVHKATVVWVVYVCSDKFVYACLTFYFETITDLHKCSKNSTNKFSPCTIRGKVAAMMPHDPCPLEHISNEQGTVSCLPTEQPAWSEEEHWYVTPHGIFSSHSGSASCPNDVF